MYKCYSTAVHVHVHINNISCTTAVHILVQILYIVHVLVQILYVVHVHVQIL